MRDVRLFFYFPIPIIAAKLQTAVGWISDFLAELFGVSITGTGMGAKF